MSQAVCRACGKSVPMEAAFCPFCGCQAPAAPPQWAPPAAPEGVGQPYGPAPGMGWAPLPSGNDPALLPYVQGWNWGAFVISWIWAFSHQLPGWGVGMLLLNLASWIPVIGFPFSLIGLGLAIYLGIKGNELAWRQRPFQGLEHFRATERVWRTWGIVLFVMGIVASIVYVAAALMKAAAVAGHY